MACLQKGYKPEQVYLANSRDNFNYNTYDLADECYIVAFRLLKSFADVLNRASKTGRAKFQEDKILIMEFFTELITVIRLIPSYPVEDESGNKKIR
ncbi:ANK-repeat protein mbp1 [Colletotrichum tofieldiae]|nr:ANK-repeat protein mbp1 [Colletotrichum tofieldiae]GKT81561.1 ANK-repeat protein mbp1 [Colletotrichum tofieldiae]